jgi:trehalose 6-phosphate phosphatase
MPISLDLRTSAILLDVDGTLLDIAPTPQEVHVPPSLRRSLAALQEKSGGALALVSGRLVSDIDALFHPLKFSVVGCHGAEIRLFQNGKISEHGSPPLPDEIRHRFSAVALENAPGILFEDKAYSVALHYRLAPHKKQAVQDDIDAVIAELPPHSVHVMHGKAVFEIKRMGFNKGVGVRELMRHAPFAKRRPVFVGDDVTDEDAFAVMPEFDGVAISVGRMVKGVAQRFETPTDVRKWLDRVCRESEAGVLESHRSA